MAMYCPTCNKTTADRTHEASCTSKSWIYCPECLDIKQYTGDELGHSWERNGWNPLNSLVGPTGTYYSTCSTQGVGQCIYCTAKISLPLIDHSYRVTTERSCDQWEISTCSVCGDWYYSAEAYGHNWTQVNPPTCATTGTKRCTRCSTTASISKIAHSWGSWLGGTTSETIKTAATCTETGTKAVNYLYERECSACGETETDSGSSTVTYGPIPHSYTRVDSVGSWATLTPATCSDAEVEQRQTGYDQCSMCAAKVNYTYETRDGDAAIGHTWIATADPLVYNCNICGELDYRDPALVNQWWVRSNGTWVKAGTAYVKSGTWQLVGASKTHHEGGWK